jgi:hypothetical protein
MADLLLTSSDLGLDLGLMDAFAASRLGLRSPFARLCGAADPERGGPSAFGWQLAGGEDAPSPSIAGSIVRAGNNR